MTTGEKIKELREKRGYTLEELGEKIGVGKSTIRKWENGMIKNMRRDKISKLAEALDCSPLYLLGYDIPVPDLSKYDLSNIPDYDDFNVSIPKELQDVVSELHDPILSKRVSHFAEIYSQLLESERVVVDKLLESLASGK